MHVFHCYTYNPSNEVEPGSNNSVSYELHFHNTIYIITNHDAVQITVHVDPNGFLTTWIFIHNKDQVSRFDVDIM